MTLNDNPIGASYLYLLEPEIRFLEAAVEPTVILLSSGLSGQEAGPNAELAALATVSSER